MSGCKPASRWTAERTERFTALWNHTGLSAAEIAQKIGGFESYADGGRCAVLGKAHRMNLNSRISGWGNRTRDAKRLGLEPRKREKRLPPVREVVEVVPRTIHRAPLTRCHAGMQVIGYSDVNQMAKDPTRADLRAFLAQAVRNTAAMQSPEES